MTRLLGPLLVFSWVFVMARAATAQPKPEILKAGKNATALIEIEDGEGVTATAFCVDPAGLFVTNAHVAEAGSRFKIVVNAGRPGQAVHAARVIRVEKKSDLALVQAEGAKGLTALELGRDDGLAETMELVAFGYPFGKALAKGEDYPSISVNTGRITSLRMPGGKLTSIQLDVVLNPGNSGGPVLDKAGRVIGVVQGGVRGATINFAIPVGRLSEMLASPVVVLEAPKLSYQTRSTPADWTVRLVPPRGAGDASVELAVATNEGSPRTFAAKPSGEGSGVFVARVTPVAEGPAGDAMPIAITASFGAGQIEGRVADRAVQFGDKQTRLKELRAVRSDPKPVAVLRDGTELTGVPGGLDSVPIDLGGVTVTADLGRASRVEFQAAAQAMTLRCTVTVRRGRTQVASVERTFELREGDAGASEGLADLEGGPSGIRPPSLASDRVQIKLPGTVTDVAAGASGRLLLLTLKDLKKLAVFDANAGKVVRILALPSDDALVAAGARKLVIVSPGQGVVHRWDLATLERERSATLPWSGRISSIAMGSGSSGPVMAFVTNQTANAFNSAAFAFFDADTLKPIKGFHQSNLFMNNRQNVNADIERAGLIFSPHFSQATERVQLRASLGGELFAAWSTMHSPAGLLSFAWKDKKTVEFHYDHADTGYIAPGPDGKTLFTKTGSLYDESLKQVGGELGKNCSYVPSTVANYFVGLEGNRAMLFVTRTTAPLVVLGELNEFPATSGSRPNFNNTPDLIADKRIQFIPQANVLVTVPPDKDYIVVRRINPVELLKKSEIDYLFVESLPVTEARKGKAYEYSMKVQSRKGKVKYELSGGPDGMTISREGRLTWDVPPEFEGDDVTPIVLVKDASGQEVFHTFTVHLR
jgi:S1-C subfamily serine protease